MSATLAIARRDLLGAFAGGAGWVVMALFLLLCGIVFASATLRTGAPASLRAVLQAAGWALLAIAPAISMRSVSDEFRQGTFETLITAPISERQIILGKFLGALALLAMILLPTLLLAIPLELHGRPDYGEMACGYLGVLLIGSLYLATGILISTLTASQLVSYLVTLLLWLALLAATRALPAVLPPIWADVAIAADPLRRLGDFTIGLLDSANVAFFLIGSIAALAAATASLQRRRFG